MFSSPAIRVFSQENTGTAPKKPGATNTLSRKPFIDRTVNGSTPDIKKQLKSEPLLKKPGSKLEKKQTPKRDTEDDDLFFYDVYSFKDMNDNYPDINQLTQKDTLNILRSYCNYSVLKTPPPEPVSDVALFIEMPQKNLFCDSKFFGDPLLELSIDDVSLPEFDLD